MQRKLQAKSKHELRAKQELQEKLEKLQQGIVPKEYRDVISKPKKFTANEAFITNPDLKQEYQNRSYVSDLKRQEEQLKEDGIYECTQEEAELA